jgi:hypothetical protein
MALLVGENRQDEGGSELVAFATKQTFGLFNRVLNQLALCTLISSGPLSGCDMF